MVYLYFCSKRCHSLSMVANIVLHKINHLMHGRFDYCRKARHFKIDRHQWWPLTASFREYHSIYACPVQYMYTNVSFNFGCASLQFLDFFFFSTVLYSTTKNKKKKYTVQNHFISLPPPPHLLYTDRHTNQARFMQRLKSHKFEKVTLFRNSTDVQGKTIVPHNLPVFAYRATPSRMFACLHGCISGCNVYMKKKKKKSKTNRFTSTGTSITIKCWAFFGWFHIHARSTSFPPPPIIVSSSNFKYFGTVNCTTCTTVIDILLSHSLYIFPRKNPFDFVSLRHVFLVVHFIVDHAVIHLHPMTVYQHGDGDISNFCQIFRAVSIYRPPVPSPFSNSVDVRFSFPSLFFLNRPHLLLSGHSQLERHALELYCTAYWTVLVSVDADYCVLITCCLYT